MSDYSGQDTLTVQSTNSRLPGPPDQRGEVRCRHVSCPQTNCDAPQQEEGQCCPKCLSKSLARNPQRPVNKPFLQARES